MWSSHEIALFPGCLAESQVSCFCLVILSFNTFVISAIKLEDWNRVKDAYRVASRMKLSLSKVNLLVCETCYSHQKVIFAYSIGYKHQGDSPSCSTILTRMQPWTESIDRLDNSVWQLFWFFMHPQLLIDLLIGAYVQGTAHLWNPCCTVEKDPCLGFFTDLYSQFMAKKLLGTYAASQFHAIDASKLTKPFISLHSVKSLLLDPSYTPHNLSRLMMNGDYIA